jgi:hypothetical protein
MLQKTHQTQHVLNGNIDHVELILYRKFQTTLLKNLRM